MDSNGPGAGALRNAHYSHTAVSRRALYGVIASVSASTSIPHPSDTSAHVPWHTIWWPAALAFIVIGAFYALVSDRLTVGPRWALPAVAIATILGASGLRWRGLFHLGRWYTFAALAVITTALTVSAGYLLVGLISHSVEAIELLKGGTLLWASNIITFALWYWEVDAGGPAQRHMTGCGSTDFAFPQTVLDQAKQPGGWQPEYIDYLFLAFNTNTAFSPTDTLVLARRAKVMMMYQSVLSLVCVVVVVARAINAL